AAGRACAGGIGTSEAVEYPIQGVRSDPASLVLDLDHDSVAQSSAAQLDGIALLGELDRVLEQGVEGGTQPVRVDDQVARRERAQPPGPGSHVGPAHE